LKKPMVEKHYTQKCRACYVLTCIDCLKDFEGDDYKTHNTCMSEEQRYSKEGRAGWDPTVGQGNKGEKRQNAWIANLRKILQENTDLDSDVKNILDTIQEHENIPRKKPKFINFVKNIMRNRARPHSIDKTWELFEQALKPPAALSEPMDVQNSEPQNGESTSIAGSETNGKEKTPENTDEEDTRKEKKKKKKDKNAVSSNTTDVEMNGKENTPETEEEGGRKEKKKKKKEKKLLGSVEAEASDTTKSRKRKNSETGEDEESSQNDEETVSKKAKFDWDEVITDCLKGKSGNEMKLVKLKKKCLREYFSVHEGTHKTKEEVGAKFDKKLKKRSYKVLKDRVKLVGEENGEEKSEEEEVMQGAAPRPEGWQSAPAVPKPKPAMSFNKWEGADMGSTAQTEKFRRLMGIKAAPKPQEVSSTWGRDDKKMFRELEQGFEKARETHFGGRSFNM